MSARCMTLAYGVPSLNVLDSLRLMVADQDCPIILSDVNLLANDVYICINLYNIGGVRLLKELWDIYPAPMPIVLLTNLSQPTTSSLPPRSSLSRLPVVLVVCVCLTTSSNGGGFSYGGGATTNVGGMAGRGAMANSSSVLTRSASPRLSSLLRLLNLAYNTETKKNSAMAPILAPTMIPVYVPLD